MIFFILLLGLGLRLINLNQSLWLDEAISFLAVKNYNFFDIITKFSPGDVHPPLYYLILKFWTNFFGFSEIALRFPSVIAGVLAVFVIYKIGGKVPALFLAVNPLAIYYSQEARMYSLAMLLVLLAVSFFLKGKKLWFIIFLALAFYTDYIPWLIFPVFLPLSFLVFIFLAPWSLTMWQQFQANVLLAREVPLWGQVVGGFSFKALELVPIKFIFGRIPAHLIFALPTVFYGWILTKTKNRFLWSWLLIPIFLGFLISFKIPIFTYHRFLFVLPAFILLLAEGVKNSIKVIMFIIFISFISLMIFNLNPRFWRENWRAATAYINSDPGKVVMPNLAQSASLTYYGAKMNTKNNPVYLIRYVQEVFDPEDTERKFL
ncbi:glycosyltransferase family 39 protein, partial [Candidatus Gottesmanbacteria bacterium]|nr:glycosyltransferase family 39 protein [Candidatus Gottesmanbacteria bacterium]